MQEAHYLVTGAGKGIGFETVRTLLEQGNRVTAVSRKVDALVQMADSYPSQQLMIEILDLQDAHAIEFFVQNLQFPLSGVVNNAGLLVNAPFEQTTDEHWQQLWEVNVMATVRLLRTLKTADKLLPLAHILNISSMGGLQGSSKFPGLSAYSATKGALSILSEALATEWAGFPIYVNALCLGAVQTRMLEQAFPGFKPPISASQMGEFVANFVTDHSGLISGKVLPIAGQDPA